VPQQKAAQPAESLKRQRWLKAVHDIQTGFSGSGALSSQLKTSVERFRGATGAQVVQVYLCSDGTSQLELAASAGIALAPGGLSYQPGRGYARLAVSRGTLLNIRDLEREEEVECRDLFLGLDLPSCLAVPLVGHRQILGALVAFARRPFLSDAETTRFVETVAGQIGLAIDRASLRQQLQESGGTLSTPRLGLKPSGSLTQSQLTILQLLVDGKSNRQIAETVHLSENTVKFHLRELFRKLNARNRLQAVMAALKQGLI
jgi:DNA-binding CsgD family transcriptional regulator